MAFAPIGNPNNPPLVRWRGYSGRIYDFQLDQIGALYHDRPGVYIACKLASNGNWDPIYIGETSSFRDRLTDNLLTHHKWQRFRAVGATHFCTLHVPGGLALREGIETDLRRQIRTPCNDQ